MVHFILLEIALDEKDRASVFGVCDAVPGTGALFQLRTVELLGFVNDESFAAAGHILQDYGPAILILLKNSRELTEITPQFLRVQYIAQS